jgi:hypothetical protein
MLPASSVERPTERVVIFNTGAGIKYLETIRIDVRVLKEAPRAGPRAARAHATA